VKIALVISGDLNTLTGGYLYDRMMVTYLQECGHRVEVLSLSGATYGAHLVAGFQPAPAIALARVSCDIMIQDALVHPALWLANRYIRRRRPMPIVALAHMVLSAQPRGGWKNRSLAVVEKAFYLSVDGCIANSRTTLSHLSRWGVLNRPFLVAPPGADRLGYVVSRRSVIDRAAAPGPVRLLFLGNVLPGKGLLPLLAALARVADADWRLTVAGSLSMDSRHVRDVRASIRRLGLSGKVRLAGTVAGRALAGLLRRSHLMAMPFSHEGFGMAIVEGMAYGLPAIASCRGAAPETVAPGINGILVPPDQPDTIGDAVRRLSRDRDALARMGIHALDTAHRHVCWSDTFGMIENFLRRMVGR
jgi:glycosyltransferase involved in cell wall biosynthesis